jgi:IS30 family transposase
MPRGKGKHLDISDRVTIEKSLKEGDSLSQIARILGVSTSTVSREVKQNRTRYLVRASIKRELCVHYGECAVTGLCDVGCARTACKRCRSNQCTLLCPEWEERTCGLLEHAPFVCGTCRRRANCKLRRARYSARDAQTKYERRLCESRSGVSVTPEQLESMVSHARRLMAQGHSIEAIWAENPGLFPVSARTFRSYVDKGVFGLANIELPKKVRYKPRRRGKAASGGCVDATGRTYEDFLALAEDLRRAAFQLDCIMGRVGDSQCAMSFHVPRIEFQIYLLLSAHVAAEVARAMDFIELACGGAFARLFPVGLTDRGSEFSDAEGIERSVADPSRKRCSIYYCDPMASHQKGSCEKNHVEFRKIVPKGTSMDLLDAADMAAITSHVNSYPRPSLGGMAPMDLALAMLPRSLFEELGIGRVEPDEVVMTPRLLGLDRRGGATA